LLALALVVNFLDVVSGAMHWHGNLAGFRFFFGLLLGLGVGSVLALDSVWSRRSAPLEDVPT
jgi:hypothetical protein